MKPGEQRKTWGYTDGPCGGDVDDDDDDDDDDAGGYGSKWRQWRQWVPRQNFKSHRQRQGKRAILPQNPRLVRLIPALRPPLPGFGGRDSGARDDGESAAPNTQRATKPKPSLFGPEITPFAPLAQQLGLPPAFYTNNHGQQPILPSGLPTRHVSQCVTNIHGRSLELPLRLPTAQSQSLSASVQNQTLAQDIVCSPGISSSR